MAMQKCPVCEGRGNVPANFYTRSMVGNSANPIECRTCKGAGIIPNSDCPESWHIERGTNPNSGFRYLDDDTDRWDWWNRRGEAWVVFDPPFAYTITNSKGA